MDDPLFNPLLDDVEKIVSPRPPDDTAQTLSDHDLKKLATALLALRTQADHILNILQQKKPDEHGLSEKTTDIDGQRIIEGSFDGEKMIGDDQGSYTVPPNYASKSKLVEGDRLKLTITPSGTFIYKQVKPIERKRIVGELTGDEITNQWGVFAEGKLYKILKASVTFYKGKTGDDVVILIAEHTPCTWGAVDNIIHK